MSAHAKNAEGETARAREAFRDAAGLLYDAKSLSFALDTLAGHCGPGASAYYEHALSDGVSALSRFLQLAAAETDRIEQRLNGFVEQWDRPAPTQAA